MHTCTCALTSLIVSDALINLEWFSYTRYCMLLSSSCISVQPTISFTRTPLSHMHPCSHTCYYTHHYCTLTFLHAFFLLVQFIEWTFLEHLLHEERWLETGLVNVHRIILLLQLRDREGGVHIHETLPHRLIHTSVKLPCSFRFRRRNTYVRVHDAVFLTGRRLHWSQWEMELAYRYRERGERLQLRAIV